jgi:hypothetical protein
MTADTRGDVYLAGRVFVGGYSPQYGRFVRKLDSAGRILWTASENTPDLPSTSISAIAVDEAGQTFVTGTFGGVWRPSGGWQYGTNTLSALGWADLYLAKFGAGGSLLWVVRAGGDNPNWTDQASSLAVDQQGNVILTGTLGQLVPSASPGHFVAKFDSAGRMTWVSQTGGAAGNYGTAIGLDVNNNIYVAGYFYGQADFGTNRIYSRGYTDLFVAKYDTAGNTLWVKQGGGNWDFNQYSSPQDVPNGIAVGRAGDVYLTGQFRGPSQMGNFQIASEGLEDVFIARLGVSPLIDTQPDSDAVVLGQPVTLSIRASGSSPLSYQWLKDGLPIAGATNAAYAVANIQTNDAGLYRVVVSNEFGSVTSAQATLIVNTEGVAFSLYAGVTIVGHIGKTYQVRYATDLSQPTWTALTNITLSAPTQLWFDLEPALRTRRYYSVLPVP